MENNTNLLEILKYAPIGLNLWDDVFGNVKLHAILDEKLDFNIGILTKNDAEYYITKYGKHVNNDVCQCTLWPSVKHRSWKNWQNELFNVGDIIFYSNKDFCDVMLITEKGPLTYCVDSSNTKLLVNLDYCSYASPEGKEEFLKLFKLNGYIWNSKYNKVQVLKYPERDFNNEHKQYIIEIPKNMNIIVENNIIKIIENK